MKKILMMVLSVSIVIAISITGAYAGSSIRVKKKKDDIVVKSHRRTRPDKSKLNNFSTKGNINPYTGKKGTKDPAKKEKKKKK